MVNVLVTADVPVTLTKGGEKLQVAPLGQPLATPKLTVPVNPFCGATLSIELPVCPGAEMVTFDGFADTLKSVTARVTWAEVEPV